MMMEDFLGLSSTAGQSVQPSVEEALVSEIGIVMIL